MIGTDTTSKSRISSKLTLSCQRIVSKLQTRTGSNPRVKLSKRCSLNAVFACRFHDFMDLVQDVVLGSFTGLALRGLRRLVLGQPEAAQASQVGIFPTSIRKVIDVNLVRPAYDHN